MAVAVADNQRFADKIFSPVSHVMHFRRELEKQSEKYRQLGKVGGVVDFSALFIQTSKYSSFFMNFLMPV